MTVNPRKRSIIALMRIFRLSIWALALLISSAARGGDVPGAGSATNSTTKESHGWIADTMRPGIARILHLPPRGMNASGQRGAADGAVRVATILAQRPEVIAAIDNRLYMIFPPTSVGHGGELRRQVLTFDAERGSLDGVWVSEAGAGRLPVLASLPGDAVIRGFVGCPAGPVVLIDQPGPDGVPVEELLVLKDGVWTSLPLPEAVSGRMFDPVRLDNDDTGIRLVAEPDGVSLVLIDGDQPGAWRARLDAKSVAADAQAWKWTALSLESSGSRVRPPSAVFKIRDHYVFERRQYGTVELWMVEASGCRKLASIAGVPSGYGVAPLDQTGRIAVVWWADPKSDSGQLQSTKPSEARTRIVEVSALTGQVLFDGEAERQLPFSSTDVKIVAVFLVIVMLTIVVFVLRPDKQGPPLVLPKGVFLAEPGRRMAAGAVDAVIAMVIASQATRIGWAQLSDLETVLKETHVVWLFLATVGVGFTLGTLTEWLFGRTAGKAIMGCEVARARAVTGPSGEVTIEVNNPELWRAAVRNVVKWLVPPVAISGVSTAERRHRGDTAADTVVVMREDPEEE